MQETQESKHVELSNLFELENYRQLLQEGFINMKAENFRTYIERYNEIFPDCENRFEAIRRTAAYFGVSRRTIKNYLEYTKII